MQHYNAIDIIKYFLGISFFFSYVVFIKLNHQIHLIHFVQIRIPFKMASSKKKRVDDVEQDAEIDDSGEEFDEDDMDSGDDEDEEEPMEEVSTWLLSIKNYVLWVKI